MSTASKPRATPRPRRRRRQADRSAATRSRLLEAVVEAIARDGFAQTSAKRIAEQAGLSWGAVQHHFGGKTEILEAVLEHGLARLESAFEDVDPAGLDLDERARLFVERAWRHYRSRHYRSTLEIILGMRREADGEPADPVHERMVAGVDRLWRRVFDDVDVDATARLDAQVFAFATLSGLAVQCILQRGDANIDRQLDTLARTIVTLLAGADAADPRRNPS